MSKYVVKIEHREAMSTEVKHSDKYLVFAHYNPYNKPHNLTDYKWVSDDQNEAFKFHERAAAEVIAATWGGKVVKLRSKQRG